MSVIPLDLQRKFEQRWAAQFLRLQAAPERIGLKARVRSLPRPNPKVIEWAQWMRGDAPMLTNEGHQSLDQ